MITHRVLHGDKPKRCFKKPKVFEKQMISIYPYKFIYIKYVPYDTNVFHSEYSSTLWVNVRSRKRYNVKDN